MMKKVIKKYFQVLVKELPIFNLKKLNTVYFFRETSNMKATAAVKAAPIIIPCFLPLFKPFFLPVKKPCIHCFLLIVN